jgi:hypothetical protein
VFLTAVVFFTLVGVLVVLPDAVRNPGNSVFDAIWLAILGWFWFNILRTPFEARISPDGLVHFRGLARRVVVAAAEIRQIRGISGGYGMRIEHNEGADLAAHGVHRELRVPHTDPTAQSLGGDPRSVIDSMLQTVEPPMKTALASVAADTPV